MAKSEARSFKSAPLHRYTEGMGMCVEGVESQEFICQLLLGRVGRTDYISRK